MRKSFLFRFVALFVVLSLAQTTRADEGMWLPLYANVISGNMHNLGCKLKPEDIYNINRSSLKDAIVQVGDFCTGEIVSDKGLLFTNHHCGYEAIASLSKPEKNHLKDGYWAKSFAEELPAEGLTVSILVYMKDVSKEVNEAEDQELQKAMIAGEVEEQGNFTAGVFSMFEGAEHYLMVYRVFRDIRFVGAPPESIGKFGGDTDNWMWPRHTGDFSVFRIYAGKDNEPADYSPDNVPYKPAHFLPVSLKGVKENDFAMTFGFPAQTERYLSSYAIEHNVSVNYPAYSKILGERLAIMKSEMDADPKIKLELASDYASLSNSRKYFQGVVEGAAETGFLKKKQEDEKAFMEWVLADEGRKKEYGNLLAAFKEMYQNSSEAKKMENYINVAAFAPGFAGFGFQFYSLKEQLSKKSDTKAMLENIRAIIPEHFAKYNPQMDMKMLAMALRLMKNDLPENRQPDIFTSKTFLALSHKTGSDVYDQYAAIIASKSFLFSEKKSQAFLKKPSLKKLEADEGMKYILSVVKLYQAYNMELYLFELQNEALMNRYIKAQREMHSDRFFYPDANSSLRLSYGQVKPYTTRNNVVKNYYTHHYQILEKEKPGDPEFDVPKKLHDLLTAKDFGAYAQNDTLRVCLISGNDITGGNSGSPLIDAEGNLVGIAFDGNWESMISDLYYDPAYARTISVDIRYVLFIIDKFGEAKRIIDELVIKS